MSVYDEVLARYAQNLSTETVTPGSQNDSQTMDPSQLQPGQPVYSPEGKEFVVLNNPAGESQKVVMPSDQQGSQLPQGVTTVDDTELSSEYTLTSPSTETKIQSSRRRMYAGREPLINTQEPDELEEITDMDDDRPGLQTCTIYRFGKTVQIVWGDGGTETFTAYTEDAAHGDFVDFVERFRENYVKKTALRAEVHMNLPAGYATSISTAEGSKSKESAGLRIGQEGYVDIMTSIQDMVEAGYDTVDVVLNIGELYPRDIGERVLEEARERGIL
jgi:hypothetical protein